MKFLTLNVDFSSPSHDLLHSMQPAHQDVKEGYPLKSGYLSAIALSSTRTVADRHRLATYHNEHW